MNLVIQRWYWNSYRIYRSGFLIGSLIRNMSSPYKFYPKSVPMKDDEVKYISEYLERINKEECSDDKTIPV